MKRISSTVSFFTTLLLSSSIILSPSPPATATVQQSPPTQAFQQQEQLQHQHKQQLHQSKPAVALTTPAKIAFTRNQHLWILDASQPRAVPKQITNTGNVTILDWSHDGEWLLYTQQQGDPYQSPAYLWLVKADGKQFIQVDQRPVTGTPQWAPGVNKIAYFLQEEQEINRPINIAELGTSGEIRMHHPIQIHAPIMDLAWMPDSKTILASIPAGRDRAMQLAKIDTISGRQVETYRLGVPPNIQEGIYPYLATDLAISPNGRYVAYYEIVTSGSLSADGVAIKLFDMQASKPPTLLGSGLAYREWLQWSADSKKLAFVDGTGREATTNKHIVIINPSTRAKLGDTRQQGKVDTQPVWPQKANDPLYFTRGEDTRDWPGTFAATRVLLPGQQIWSIDNGRKTVPVTKGDQKHADLFPSPSPDNRHLIYVRLDRAEHGSLYVKHHGQPQAQLLAADLSGEIGYYGNYLPEWVKVYWKNKNVH